MCLVWAISSILNHNNSPSRRREWRRNPFSTVREMFQKFYEKGRMCWSVGGDRHIQSGFLEEGNTGKGGDFSMTLEHSPWGLPELEVCLFLFTGLVTLPGFGISVVLMPLFFIVLIMMASNMGWCDYQITADVLKYPGELISGLIPPGSPNPQMPKTFL